MQIRDARESDAEGIAAIYNDAVDTTAIWNDAKVDAANRRAWLLERQQAGFPILVVLDDREDVLGYASFGPWRAWDGYRHTVEHSVYVRGDRRGAGVGRALMEELIARAIASGMHVMVAGVEAKNLASIRFHEKLGFAQVGYFQEVGCKFGAWLDLVFLQRTLDRCAFPK